MSPATIFVVVACPGLLHHQEEGTTKHVEWQLQEKVEGQISIVSVVVAVVCISFDVVSCSCQGELW